MRGKAFVFVIFCFLLLTTTWAVVAYQLGDFNRFDAWDYAFDTTTFRARIQRPDDKELGNPTVFKACEQVVTALTLLLIGWGYSITQDASDARRLRHLFIREGHEMTWPEFLRENEPALYEAHYGKPAAEQGWWDRFRKWLLDL
jgi:hypothetical protein